MAAERSDPQAMIAKLTGARPGFTPNGHAPEPTLEAGRFGPAIISADALMSKTFPPPRWAVEGVLAEGLTLFVGPPKIGKSWLCLNIAIAVALGGMAMGKILVEGGDVLYLALEDTERRLQERIFINLQGDHPPSRLHIATTWPTLADGAADHLREWLQSHPDARLVVVDTLARLRGPIPGNANIYAADYDAVGKLKSIADAFGVALVLVHHTRKAIADDPLDMVSGTNGQAGAADTTCVLRKEIGRSDANLYVRGRDVPEVDHALSFDPKTCTWTLLGDVATYRRSLERQDIIDVLTASPEPMAPKAIAKALGKKDGAVRNLLHWMVKAGEIAGIGGAYRLPNSPSNTANTANARVETPETPRKTTRTGVRGPGSAPNGDSPREETSVSGVSGVSGGPVVSAVSGVRGGTACRHLPTCRRPARLNTIDGPHERSPFLSSSEAVTYNPSHVRLPAGQDQMATGLRDRVGARWPDELCG